MPQQSRALFILLCSTAGALLIGCGGGGSGAGIGGQAPSGPQVFWATSASATSEYGPSDWSASQAVGAPDTESCGDLPTAWASLSPTGVDVLRLEYASSAVPQQVDIYESHNPGAITRVEVVGLSGTVYTIYTGQPENNPTCPNVFSIPVEDVSEPVNIIVLYVDQTDHAPWTKIDAVALVGTP